MSIGGPDEPVLWERLTWEELAGLRDCGVDMAILPVGATEQHGAHLPTGVDTLSAQTVAERASVRTGIPVLPALPFGCSLGHSAKWAGTLSLRPETLARVVAELGEWLAATGFTRLLLLNGHYTNWAPLRCALENLRHDRPAMRIALRSLWELSPAVGERYTADGANFHANRAETSLMLACFPGLVDLAKAVDEPDRAASCFFAYTMDKETPSGVVGCPSGATAAEGADLLGQAVDALVAQLEAALNEGTPLEEWAEGSETAGPIGARIDDPD
jgi:creatinine amidohydrolase